MVINLKEIKHRELRVMLRLAFLDNKELLNREPISTKTRI